MSFLTATLRKLAAPVLTGIVIIGFGSPMAIAAIDPFNSRPVVLSNNGSSLQSIFQTNYQSGSCSNCPNFQTWGVTDVNTQQSSAGMWAPDSNVSINLVVELASRASTNRVGIFSGTGVGTGDTMNVLELFNGPANSRDRAVVTISGNDVTVRRYNELLGFYVPSPPQVFNNFLVGGMMGFYLSNANPTAINNTAPRIAGTAANGSSVNLNDFYFTADELNSTGPQAVAYQSAARSHEWAIAFDDMPFSTGDRDFDDFVLTVGGLQPTPEPAFYISSATMILLLGGSVIWRRRRQAGL